jgi:hypothetical protein
MTLLETIHADPDSGSPPTVARHHPYMDEPEPQTADVNMVAAMLGLKLKPAAGGEHGG